MTYSNLILECYKRPDIKLLTDLVNCFFGVTYYSYIYDKFMCGFVNEYFQNFYKERVLFFAKIKKISVEELKEIINLMEHSKS